MRDKINAVFPCFTGICMEIYTNHTFWVDEYLEDINPQQPRGKSYGITTFDESIEDQPFKIFNPSQKEINFLAIDKGLLLDIPEHPARCDFAVFDNLRFCFVESKTSTLGQRSKERKDAIKQLKSTIQLFQEKINFEGFQIEAQVSLRAKRIYPRQNSHRQNDVKEFEDELNVSLYENNTIEF